MAASAAVPTRENRIEDPLDYLPFSSVVEFRRGQVIYEQHQPSTNIYMVTDGAVKISRLANDGHQVCIDVYQRDGLFGESAFLGIQRNGEQATALESTRLMTWTPSQIEEVTKRSPGLAVALMQMVVQRNCDFSQRIESFGVDDVPRRLARCLIRFGDRLGKQQTNGSALMMPLTHELLAQYVGTSREVVTHFMARFRRDGFVQYSRRSITVYQDALHRWLRLNT